MGATSKEKRSGGARGKLAKTKRREIGGWELGVVKGAGGGHTGLESPLLKRGGALCRFLGRGRAE